MIKKIIISVSAICCGIFTLNSCEDDNEVCTEGTTARLVLKFFDKATNTVESRSGIISTNEMTNYAFTAQDSIAIPLTPINSVDTLFIRESSEATAVDTIVLDFTREEQFVSKGCGFKINYNNLSANLLNLSTTISKVELNPNLLDSNNQINVTDETEAHIFIYN